MDPDFIYSIAALFEDILFVIFEKLGNIPNVLLFVTGFVLLFWWLKWQYNLSREAEEKGMPK